MTPTLKAAPAETLTQLEARAKAASSGREFELLTFVDDLLATMADAERLVVQRTEGTGLLFDLDGASRVIELPLGAYMLRPICARLAALCKEAPGQDVSPYGGEGMLPLPSGRLCRLEFSNQPGDVWLRLTPEPGATA